MKGFEFLKPVGKKQLIHTTPAHQKLLSDFYNIYLVIPMVLNLWNGMGDERGVGIKKTGFIKHNRY